MGFKDDKAQVLADLSSLNFDHQGRSGQVEDENLLAAGLISVKKAKEIVSCTNGRQYESRPHHQVSFPPVWIFKPQHQGIRWYIKGYFLGSQSWFISFHPSKS